MSVILVTGAGGYIGTTLVPLLLERGYHVRAVDRFFFGRDLLAPHENLEIIKEDTRRLNARVFSDVEAVIDLVAISNDASSELFAKASWEINWRSRVRTAKLAKQFRVARYILPSSCSIYGYQDPEIVVDELSATNPLTTYAKANERAERDTLALADNDFHVTVLRQATVYGYSPRMRFDLAINGMTYGAWCTGKLPTMRDGTQWRPMVHVRDAAEAQAFMLEADPAKVSGQIFNVGSAQNNYQIGPLAEIVAATVPRKVEIEWYGDPDTRSYRVNFDKIASLGYQAKFDAEDGVRELCEALEHRKTDKTPQTITLEWYKELHSWFQRIKETELYGGILNIEDSDCAIGEDHIEGC